MFLEARASRTSHTKKVCGVFVPRKRHMDDDGCELHASKCRRWLFEKGGNGKAEELLDMGVRVHAFLGGEEHETSRRRIQILIVGERSGVRKETDSEGS
jgi:hypothetical protein